MRPLTTQLQQAAEWVAGLDAASLPDDVVALARAQRLNILACMYAGTRTAVGRRVIAATDAVDPGDAVTTLADGRRRSLLAAAYVGAVCATALELDDFVFAGHTGQAAVTVAWTLGQLTGARGEEALAAQIAANEVAGRLGAVMTAGPQHGHMKAYLNRAAAATAAARLLHLDAETTARALGIALSMPEYPLFPASFSPDTKALCTGDPVTAGIRAAYLAAEGIAIAPDVVEHPIGLVISLSHHDRVPPIWDRLGITWSTQAICFKPVAACAYACAAAVAAGEIVAGEGAAWDPGRVRKVDVDTTVLTLTMEGFAAPHVPGAITPINTNFSTRRTVALCLAAGAPRGTHFTPGRFAQLAPRIAAGADRVRLRHSWPLTMHLLHGVDAAIDHPGRPGIYGMVEAHRTLGRFHATFATPRALGMGDVAPLLRLPRAERWYLLRRYAVGLRSRLPFRGGATGRAAYVARETDLRDMALRFGAAVRITLDDGRVMAHEIVTPPGFAGDRHRADIPHAKFLREAGDALSPPSATALCSLLEREPTCSPSELARAIGTLVPGDTNAPELVDAR